MLLSFRRVAFVLSLFLLDHDCIRIEPVLHSCGLSIICSVFINTHMGLVLDHQYVPYAVALPSCGIRIDFVCVLRPICLHVVYVYCSYSVLLGGVLYSHCTLIVLLMYLYGVSLTFVLYSQCSCCTLCVFVLHS